MLKLIKKKSWVIASLVLVIILLLSLPAIVSTVKNSNQSTSLEKNSKQIAFDTLEIADNNDERAQGYMFRTDICDNCGMLFVMDKPVKASFWMKDTPTSLDIIFLTEDGFVDSIHQSAKPNSLSPTYKSNQEVLYALEVKAGWSQENNLNEGENIDIEYLFEQGIPYQEEISI